jgi:hypothetical protein
MFRSSFQLLVHSAEIFKTAEIILRKELVKIRSHALFLSRHIFLLLCLLHVTQII